MRSVWLGGELKTRAVVRVERTAVGDYVGAGGACVAGMVIVLAGGGTNLGTFLLALLVAGAGVGTCWPWAVLAPWTGGASVRGWVMVRLAFVRRRRLGWTSFPGQGLPAGVGNVSGIDVSTHAGPVGVLRPSGAGDWASGEYLVVVLEAQGVPGGSGDGAAWSALLSALGGGDGDLLVSHVAQVSTTREWDSTDHVWLTSEDLKGVESVDAELTASYGQVVDRVRSVAAARRTWVALRFPLATLMREAADGDFEALAAESALAVAERGGSVGVRMRACSCRDVAGVVRSILDPDVSADDLRDLPEEAEGWSGCVPAFESSPDGRCLVIEGAVHQWWMSAWSVPGSSVSPGWLPADFLYPISTALPGTIPRTMVVQCELVPARVARAQAKADLTSDLSAMSEEGTRVSDGGSQAQATGSQVRLNDLAPGSGAVGVNWSMSMAFHARGEAEMADATRRVVGALSDAQIERALRRRFQQDMMLGQLLPLGLGWHKGWRKYL